MHNSNLLRQTKTIHQSNMKTQSLFPSAIALLFLSTLNPQLSTVFAQGSLTPPGAPAPTMKTLAQVEPRTPISSVPYTISSPGSYYLTATLTNTGVGIDAITINADDVTLDLKGFTLMGGPSAGSAINVPSDHRHIVVRNGGIVKSGNPAVALFPAQSCEVEHLHIEDSVGNAVVVGDHSVVIACTISNAGYYGISTRSGCRVENCLITASFSYGIWVATGSTVSGCLVQGGSSSGIVTEDACLVKDCISSGNAGNGVWAAFDNCTVKDCVSSGNAVDGIHGGHNCTLRACTLSGNAHNGITTGTNNLILACSAANNGNAGIQFGDGTSIKDCTASGNVAEGIFGGLAATVSGCMARANGNDGIYVGVFSRVRNCTSLDNAQYGISTGFSSTVSDCASKNNQSDGIFVPERSVVLNNTSDNNGGSGVHAFGSYTRIEGNKVTFNTQNGIKADTFGNFVIKNMATANGTNYNLAANNKVGVIVAAPVSAAISGSTGGAGVGSTDPWANFSY